MLDAVLGGTTALMLAAWKGNEAVVRVLVEAGAALDVAEAESGSTALLLAAGRGDEAVVRLLIEA